ncbi:MAG: sigma-70 family RNA polymerase sigma factor [Planctomycetes bacterium]|nr:sigma-70 family RNA polymerase sigma factor [Planctomycetota bacterium]
MDPDSPPPLDPALLLAHDGFVRRLARELLAVGGPAARAQSDDVAQQAMVAALTRGPSDPATLRGWLATVVRRLAARTRISAARRLARERAVARPEAIDAAGGAGGAASSSGGTLVDYLSRERLRRRVVDAAFALPDPYRATLLLRFLDELPPREVARRMGVPVETVRTRVRRALEQLRVALGDEYGGDDSTRGAALLDLAALAGTGASVMTAKWASVGAVVLLAGALAWRSLAARLEPQPPREETAQRSAEPAPQVPVEDASAVRVAAVAVPAPANSADGAERSAPLPESTGSVRVRVVDEAGAPLSAVRVFVTPSFGELPFGNELVARTDATGEAVIREVPVGEVLAMALRSGRRGEVLAGEELALSVKVDLERWSTFAVEGRVVDQLGAPVAGASIWSNLPDHPFRGEVVATSASDGSFRFEGAETGQCAAVSARKEGFVDSMASSLVPDLAERIDRGIVLRLERGGGECRGVVRDALGQPVAGALVVVGSDLRMLLPIEILAQRMVSRIARATTTDGEGRFAIDGLPLGALPLLVRKAGFAVASMAVTIAAGRADERAITLVEGATLEGFVIGIDGEPVGGAVVQHGSPLQLRSVATRADESGRYRVDGVPAGRVVVRALAAESGSSASPVRAIGEVELRAGERADLDLEFEEGAAISGRVIDANGSPLQRVEVTLRGRCRDPVDPNVFATTRTGNDGCFTVDHLLEGSYELEFRRRNEALPELSRRDIAPGGPPLELRLAASAVADCWIEGRVVDAKGAAPRGATLVCGGALGGSSRHVAIGAGGEFAVGPIVPGDHRLVVLEQGRPDQLLEVRGLASGERRKLDDWILPAGVRLVVRVDRSLVGVAGAATVRISGAQGFVTTREGVDQEVVIDALPPGDYRVRVETAAASSEAQAVSLVAGSDATVLARLRATLPVIVRFMLPDRARDPQTIATGVVTLEGEFESLAHVLLPDLRGAAFDWSIALAPGSYTVRAYIDAAQSVEVALSVAVDAAPGQVTVVEIP